MKTETESFDLDKPKEDNQQSIFYDKGHVEALKQKYPAAANWLQNEVDSLCILYNQRPFKKREKLRVIQKIKEAVKFINPNIPEEEVKPKKKLEKQEDRIKSISTLKEISPEIMAILKNPDLFNLITIQEFDKKIVGEIETRKVIFLCAGGGRLVENHQLASYNLLVNDEAGTGKDYITSKVLEILPEEVYIHKTRISPAVFTYWHNSEYEPDWTWNGRVFYPEDISEMVLNSDVFKVMCSSGSSATITIRQKAVDIKIEGKPVLITTTATATPSPELTRRFVILNLDSSENQTKEIMKRHASYKKQGIVPEYNPLYKEAMKFLKRIKVIIPFADLISQHFPSKSVIMRTHFPRFLDYISASAALHQYQRDTDNNSFLIATGQDYDIARTCFLKLCSNRYMIPLTINQKKILKLFELKPTLRGSANSLHSRGMNFISLPALQTNLGILVSYGILTTSEEEDSLHRQLEVYSLSKSYNPGEKIDIPDFKALQSNLTNYNNYTNLNNLNNLNNSEIKRDTKDTKVIKARNDISNSNSEPEKLNVPVERPHEG